MSAPRLPDPPEWRGGDSAAYCGRLESWARDLTRTLQDALDRLYTPHASGWQVTNLSLDRALDCSTETLGDLRNVVGTLISDLKTGREGTTLG